MAPQLKCLGSKAVAPPALLLAEGARPETGRGGSLSPHCSKLGSAALPLPSSTLLLLPDPGRCRGGEAFAAPLLPFGTRASARIKELFKENPKLL